MEDAEQQFKAAEQLFERCEYDLALQIYLSLLEHMFERLKVMKNPQNKQSTKTFIDFLLRRAEFCKNPVIAPAPAPVSYSSSTFVGRMSTQAPLATRTKAQAVDPNLARMEGVIEQEIIDTSPSVTWEDIIGLDTAKQVLKETIVLPALYPHIFVGLRAPAKGILLFGPPGTGKTMLAKAVATECNATFFNVTAATLTSKFFGEAEKLVRALFTVARRRQPSVIFIDEVDSILTERSEGQNDASRRLQTEILIQMDGVSNSADEKVVVIGATNRPQELDEAVRRRMTKRIMIDLPSDGARRHLIEHLIRNHSNSLTDKQFASVVKKSENYSCSDIAALCKEAAMMPIRSLTPQQLSSGQIPNITMEHFTRAFQVVKPSVSARSLEFFRKWNLEFGSN
mmetsp:Transcript_26061/g.46264  ORF Transcript_26061/g.46264 Transcript_26061/m.46264 type:complete len:397 (-) Transcript_26061:1401-2591(-)